MEICEESSMCDNVARDILFLPGKPGERSMLSRYTFFSSKIFNPFVDRCHIIAHEKTVSSGTAAKLLLSLDLNGYLYKSSWNENDGG